MSTRWISMVKLFCLKVVFMRRFRQICRKSWLCRHLDVAGAPAQTAKLVKPGDTVLIIGAGGKSGMLCCYEAKKRAGVTGKVIGLCHSQREYRTASEIRLL